MKHISTTKTIWANIPKEYKRVKHDITLDQRKALKSLSEDKSIIIKEVDKGGSIVLMNVEFYKNKILEMLNNELYYSSIPNSNQKEIFAKLKELINQNENITDHEADLKIHKSQIIQNACKIKH